MTLVSDDPSWWPSIDAYRVSSYFIVAASVGVMYDWALTLGQEVELIWRQRWSLMTVLYLSVRYLGIIYAVGSILVYVPTISMTDVGCFVIWVGLDWLGVVMDGMLCAIVIIRLYAMYQRSRRLLIFLVVIFPAFVIAAVAMAAIPMKHISGEEFILSSTYQCSFNVEEDVQNLIAIGWMLVIVWEVLALCLAAWVAVVHFRELRRHSAGGIIGDCFTVLIKTHVIYFASLAAGSCLQIGYFVSPTMSASTSSLATQIYVGLAQTLLLAQMCVLGPRLILSVREYHAGLVAGSDAATDMTSIAFQEHVHVSTSSSV